MKEKEALKETKEIKEKLETARLELEAAQRTFDLSKASELKYGKIPQLEKLLKETKPDANQMLSSRVTDKDISEIVSRTTGKVVVNKKEFR